jgi:hypothetical protein
MVSPISFLDEGVRPVLSSIKEDAQADTVFVTAHGYNPEMIERVDYETGHGRRGPHGHPGGTFVATHPEYYEGIPISRTRAHGDPFGNFDVLEHVIPEAQDAGLSVQVFHLEAASTGGRELNVPGFPRVLEIDLEGRRASLPCVNHPEYRAWQLALLEDLYKSYPIDGFTWGMERWGPLHQVLLGDEPACFCAHCRRVMRDHSLDPDRVSAGYRALRDAVRAWTTNESSTSTVALIHLLLQNPEILGWENVWTQAYLSMHRELYGVAKWLAPDRPFGLCLWHPYFINPLLRAEWDLSSIAQSADCLSAFLLHFPEATRIQHFLGALCSGPLRDFEPAQLYGGFSTMLGLDLGSYEAAVVDGMKRGLPAEFVGDGVRIMRENSGTDIPIYPLVGIDVVQEGLEGTMGPSDVHDAIKAAWDAGASGIHLARNYAEMRSSNLKAAGNTIRTLRSGHKE